MEPTNARMFLVSQKIIQNLQKEMVISTDLANIALIMFNILFMIGEIRTHYSYFSFCNKIILIIKNHITMLSITLQKMKCIWFQSLLQLIMINNFCRQNEMKNNNFCRQNEIKIIIGNGRMIGNGRIMEKARQIKTMFNLKLKRCINNIKVKISLKLLIYLLNVLMITIYNYIHQILKTGNKKIKEQVIFVI